MDSIGNIIFSIGDSYLRIQGKIGLSWYQYFKDLVKETGLNVRGQER